MSTQKKVKTTPVNNLVNLIASGVVKVYQSEEIVLKTETITADEWKSAIEGKSPEEAASLAEAIEKHASDALGIKAGDQSEETASKRARLSKILLRIGIRRRATGKKGKRLDDKIVKAIYATLENLVKIEKERPRYARNVYDLALKIAKGVEA